MKRPPIAKITKPAIPAILPRDRLFVILDKSRRYPLTWIAGPPGAGKTTLVASYLTARNLPCVWYRVDEGDDDIATFFYYMGLAAKKAAPRIRRPMPVLSPEYLAGIPTFTERYFENLCSRLKPPYFLVFDNCQNVPSASPFYEIMRAGFSALPEGIRAIAISRTDPPAAFAGMQAENKMRMMGWNDLRLTVKESKGVMRLQEIDHLKNNLVLQVHEKTGGWAAGLVILSHAAIADGIDLNAMEKLPQEKIFDYFANELFDRLERPLQDFLLKTAFLDRVTAKTAALLTGNRSSGRIFSELNRSNYFTEKLEQTERAYRYHPLFREFLRNRAERVLSPHIISEIRQRAAQLLEAEGELEYAAELYIEGQKWEGLIPVILENAYAFMAQGRGATIRQWISAIPGTIRNANPWLIYWQGMCRIVGDPADARWYLEQAYKAFKRQRDRSGSFLCWAGIIDSYVYEFDLFVPMKAWIAELKRLVNRRWKFPSPEIEIAVTISMFNALYFMQPDDRDLPTWERKMEDLMHETTDRVRRVRLASYLLMYYSWIGDIGRMRTIRAEVAPRGRKPDWPPGLQLVWSILDSVYRCYTAEFEMSLLTVRSALETAKKAGARVWDMRLMVQGVHGALGSGDTGTARAYLDSAGSILNVRQRLDVAQYYYAEAYYHTVVGDLNTAREYAVKAVSLAEESGPFFPVALCHTGMAQILILQKKYKEAQEQMTSAKCAGEHMRSLTIEIKVALLKAQIDLATGRETHAVRSLRGGFAIAREKGYWSLDWWLPSVMSQLCAKALEHDVEPDYINELIRRRSLVPAEPPYHLENWPWAVRILTMGRFELLRDGKPVLFSGKAQKKPLELLKALIARGGQDVDAQPLADLLWPDSEGDAAYRALVTTVQRLRKLLGSAEAVRVQEGRLSLDNRICWVDTWAFERVYRQARDAWNRREAGSIRLLERLASLYHGPFLRLQSNDHSLITLRESLRSKFLDVLSMLSRCHEKAGEWDKAAESYLRGLDIDELAEEFYRGLMVCYQKLGNTTRALDTYRRCRTVLASGLGIEPSAETEALYKAIKSSRSSTPAA